MPLFESIDAIAIAAPTRRNRARVARFAAGAERYLNRGLRPVPGYSPYPGDRTAGTQTWFDDNGWWGLAFINAYRATGTRRCCADAERALALRRRAGWDPQRGGIWWNTDAPLQGRRGARLRDAARGAALPADALRLRPRARRAIPRLGERAGFSAADGLYAGSSLNATPVDYIEGPLIYAQATLCRLTGDAGGMRPRRRAEGDRAQPLRLPPRLLAQYDAIYLQWMLALYALDGDPTLYRAGAPTTRATRRRARSTPKACTCSAGTARRCPRANARAGHAPDAGRDDQPVRLAGGVPAAAVP